MTLEEFYNLLEAHDWHYEMSDNHSVYLRGRENEQKLSSLAANHKNQDFVILFRAYKQHIFSGEPWGTEQLPKPERPTKDV
jgi:hypothetical protein